jgi:NAD(P)H-dependent FMN reductase
MTGFWSVPTLLFLPNSWQHSSMSRHILIFYGSYRQNRQGIHLAQWLVQQIQASGDTAELVDAKAVNLPMLDQRFSDYAEGTAPPAMTELAHKISAADGFIFVVGEYNGGIQPGLKNLVDHYLPEFRRRPAAIASYSAGPFSGLRSAQDWRIILGALGMVVTSNSLGLARINQAFDSQGTPIGEDGARLARGFAGFADELFFWVDAAKAQSGR